MQYQSIISLFKHLDIAFDAKTDLEFSRLRKQIMAEFAIAHEGIIEVEGISYTKHDVLQLMNHNRWGETLQHHITIWQQPGLYNLLVHDQLDLDEAHNWHELSSNADFVHFVAPYFAPRFNGVMKSLLQENNFAAAEQWLAYLSFVVMEYEEEALKSTRLYLEDTIRLFKNINDISYKQRAQELKPWTTYVWSAFVNQLPDTILHYTDELATEIINFTVRIQKADTQLCYFLSRELMQLKNVNYSLRQLIEENHEIYAENAGAKPKATKKSAPNTYFWILGIIALLRILLKASGCND